MCLGACPAAREPSLSCCRIPMMSCPRLRWLFTRAIAGFTHLRYNSDLQDDLVLHVLGAIPGAPAGKDNRAPKHSF